MADFTVPSDIVAGLAAADSLAASVVGGRINYDTASMTTVSGFVYSHWMQPGKYGGTPTAPTTQVNLVQTSVGSLGTFVNAAGTNRLLGWSHFCQQTHATILYDRIAHMAGLSGTVTTAQTSTLDIATPAAAGRCLTDGSDVEWFLEWYTATGSTAVTATITYTNQAGTSGKTTTVSIPASVPAGRLIPIAALASGDTSIKSIQSVTLSASTLTAGNFGLTVARRLSMGYASGGGWNYDWAECGFNKVGNDACFWLVFYTNASSTGPIVGTVIVGGHT